MQSQILPISISNPFIPSSSSSSGSSSSAFSIMPISSATAGAILLKSEDYNDVDGGDVLIRSSSIEDEKNIETKSFLPRVSSHDGSYTSPVTTTTSSVSYQQRRRRAASDSAVSALGGGRRRMFGQNDWRVDWDASVIVRCGHSTLRYIGVGFRWIIRFLALGCYSILIMPGVLQVAYYYYFSNRIHRDIVFGDQPRNKLDIFLPKNDDGKNDGPKPVIAFITGGAWIIGYKAWGSLLGHHLSDRDIIVACIDYRNFPKATITDMVKDASQGISFVCNNIAEYGGDPNRIYLMGQSAGAHIAACALMEQAIKESGGKDRISWSPSQLKAYFGLSGAYNLLNLVDHFNNRGLHKSLFLSIMGGEESLRRYSPEVMAQDPNVHNAVSLLPPVVLFHGTADYSIPADSSRTFAEALQRHGVKADLMLYEEKTHTDVFVQDPMRGDDKMFDDLVTIIYAGDEEALAKHAKAPPRKRLVPECMLQLARRVSPF